MCQLSRLPLVGSIDFQTPECVITEVLETHGCQVLGSPDVGVSDPVSDLIRVLHSTTILNVPIHPHLTPDNLPLLARFVNAERHTWTVGTLFMAYDHLNQFIQGARVLPTGPIHSGPKTPDHPLSYDATMLYSLCRYHQIRTSRKTTLQQMARAIQDLVRDPKEVRDAIRAQVDTWPLNRLIEISISEPTHPRLIPTGGQGSQVEWPSGRSLHWSEKADRVGLPDLTSNESLSARAIADACQFFNASVSILRRVQPESHEEAVVLGAKIYGLNLLEAANPLREHQRLAELGTPNTIDPQYRPIDPTFRSRYIKNPEWYQIRANWVPELSGLYDHTGLTALVCAEGYTLTDLRSTSAQRLLQFSRENPTFYSGKSPYAQNTQSPIYLEDLDDLQDAMCLSYGVIASQSVVIYTVPELVEHFRTSRSFSNPHQIKESFPPIAIQKLKLICWNRIKTLPPWGMEAIGLIQTTNQSLLDAIEFVELCNWTNSVQAQALNATYLNSPLEEQQAIQTSLHLLLELSMYMRGWTVAPLAQSKYPITTKETVFDSEDQGQVFLNVTCAIRAFEEQIGSLKSTLRDQLGSLPLVRVISTLHGCIQDSNGTRGVWSSAAKSGLSFQASSHTEQGLSILDRVRIVKTGDSSTGSYSCIRLSSNWLAASAMYYLLAIGQKAPFEIELLSQIS